MSAAGMMAHSPIFWTFKSDLWLEFACCSICFSLPIGPANAHPEAPRRVGGSCSWTFAVAGGAFVLH
jgi:hypothetical protein